MEDVPSSSNVEEMEEVVVEPRFKYERILADVKEGLDKSSSSCVAIHDRYIAIGFSSGEIRMYDHLGHEHFVNSFKRHKCAVTQIGFDAPGRYIISCANDSVVHIQGVGHDEYNESLKVMPAAKCVALGPTFSKNTGQRFITGSQNLITYEKGFLGKYRTGLLFQGLDRDGGINACSWNNNLIAFTNDSATRIYDSKDKRTICFIKPAEAYLSTRFLPRHCWIDDLTLAISWGGIITIAHITSKNLDKKEANKRVEILHQWSIPDFFISGISFTTADQQLSSTRSWNELIVFGLAIDTTTNDESMCMDDSVSVISDISNITALANMASCKTKAQVLLLKPIDVLNYSIGAEDSLEMRNANLRCLNKFALVGLPHDSLYFLLGTREIIEAKPCSIDDRVTWLMENELYEEALDCALRDKEDLQNVSFSDIGRKLIQTLVEKGEFVEATSKLSQICGRNKEEWEFYVNEFEKYEQHLLLYQYIPLGQPQLEPECYESILTAALYNKTLLFKKLVCEWNPDLYRAASIIDKCFRRITDLNATESTANTRELVNIYPALAHLFAYVRNFERALSIYLLLKDNTIFNVINKYQLFSMVKDRIVELMDIDCNLAIRLLIDNEDQIPVKQVVTQLGKHPKLQMAYLDRLLTRGEGSEYVDLMVKLYANYERKKLLPFLKKTDGYRLDLALELCKTKRFIEEMVFLLGRCGNRLEALNLIMTETKKIEDAITFCSDHEDDLELWDRLIELSVTNPDHIAKVLAMAGTFVDPLNVIEKIPEDLEVPGLQSLLLKVVKDYEMKVKVLEDTSRITQMDMLDIFEKQIASNLNGFCVGSDTRCEMCGELACHYNSRLGDVLILCCHHIVHQNCIQFEEKIECPTCNSISANPKIQPTERQIQRKLASLNPFGDF